MTEPKNFVKALHAKQAANAFPLIRLLDPEIELETWLSEARALCDDTSAENGAIILVDKRDYLYGIYCFNAVRKGSGNDVLNLDKFIVVDMILCAGAAKRLIQSIDPLAQILGCPQIRIELPRRWRLQTDQTQSLCNLLKNFGYKETAGSFTKVSGTNHVPLSLDADPAEEFKRAKPRRP